MIFITFCFLRRKKHDSAKQQILACVLAVSTFTACISIFFYLLNRTISRVGDRERREYDRRRKNMQKDSLKKIEISNKMFPKRSWLVSQGKQQNKKRKLTTEEQKDLNQRIKKCKDEKNKRLKATENRLGKKNQ